MIPAIIFGILVMVIAIVAIEKKRVDGVLSYPLWTGNFFFFWALFALVFAIPISATTLPRFVAIAMHPAIAQGTVTAIVIDGHCHVTYNFMASNKPYSGTDGLCGLKIGDSHSIYYDNSAPENSTLYAPDYALKNTLIATLLISIGLAAMSVIWFRFSHIIGKRRPL